MIEYGVMDQDSGHVTEEFLDEQDARDWMDPTKGNPNWGNWKLVARSIHPWYAVDA